jgi:hypothetical protein
MIGFIGDTGHVPHHDAFAESRQLDRVLATWPIEQVPDMLEFTFPSHDLKYCRGGENCPWHALAEACAMLAEECERIAKW